MKEGGCDCVKLGGGLEMADKISAVVRAGIPVMGHIGLTPQTAAVMGGLKIQGKSSAAADKLVADIKAVEAAGAFCCIVECVPKAVGEAMCDAVNIPVHSGGPCSKAMGQGQNFYDMMGFKGTFVPKFSRHYAELQQTILDALTAFHTDCLDGTYPAPENCYDIAVPGYGPEDN
jgi:3-methyl-2-oxobutanoate hydroxymethyltransferase